MKFWLGLVFVLVVAWFIVAGLNTAEGVKDVQEKSTGILESKIQKAMRGE